MAEWRSNFGFFIFFLLCSGILLAGCRNSSNETFRIDPLKNTVLTVTAINGSVRSDPSGIDCGSDCSGNYAEGSKVKLTAIPNKGKGRVGDIVYGNFLFRGWGGGCSGSTNPLTVTMDKAKTCSASFTRLSDTGQTVSTGNTGEDSDYTINPLSFTRDGDTIIDNNTSLIWQRDGETECKKGSTTCTWSEAKTHCGELQLGGKDDWRLPNIHELVSIVEYHGQKPHINQIFANTGADKVYWTSEPYLLGNDVAYVINFNSGFRVSEVGKNSGRYVRCVRGVEILKHDFTNNGDGTVGDGKTGLIWQRSDDNIKRKWDPALTYCNELKLADKSDWRLPNFRELESIMESSKTPAIDKKIFPGTKAYYYWSSTAGPGNGDKISLNFGDGGYFENYVYTKEFYVRCVRSEP